MPELREDNKRPDFAGFRSSHEPSGRLIRCGNQQEVGDRVKTLTENLV